MTTTLNAEALAELKAVQDDHARYGVALNRIRNSRNGEFIAFYKHFDEHAPGAAKKLAEKVDRETGLFTTEYFKAQARLEVHVMNRTHEKLAKTSGRFSAVHLLQGMYVLSAPKNIIEAKDFFKTNEKASTTVVGTIDGLVGAFIHAGKQDGMNVASAVQPAVLVEYVPGTSFERMHYDGLRLFIANALKHNNVPQLDKVIESYLRRKDAWDINGFVD